MEIIRSIYKMQETVKNLRSQNMSIGFVPTMGYLHTGHEKLIEHARQENQVVVTSIFVNPLQFGPNEDFERYPRDEQHDFDVAERNNVDILFLPEATEMYPTAQTVLLQVIKRTNALCGRTRLGHFEGVVTVLTKLFNIILPDKAYFGMKDAQQVAVVEALIKDFNFPIELRPVKTVREADGLAKSSRNVYLSEVERNEAKYIYQALEHGRKLVINGEKNPNIIVEEVKDFILKHTRGKIDYVEILNYPELSPIYKINRQVILACAVKFEQARLIDNLVFDEFGTISERLK